MATIHRLSLLLFVVATALAKDGYHGAKVGALCTSDVCANGIAGTVYVVDDKRLQVVDLNIDANRADAKLKFVFANDEDAVTVDEWYVLHEHRNGDWLKAERGDLDGGVARKTIVVRIPGTLKQWKHFGIISETEWKFKAAVRLDVIAAASVPRSQLLKDRSGRNAKLTGAWYSVGASKLELIDSKTIKLYDFSFEGQKPPDGWLYAGNGRVKKGNGENAFIVGRDTKQLHCPIRELIRNKDMTIRLAGEQTIYSVDWLSVYCIAVGINFGHIDLAIEPSAVAVPPSLPPVRRSAPQSDVRNAAWIRPVIVSADGATFRFSVGPTGGARSRAMRGVCDTLADGVLYVNGIQSPALLVERGATYMLGIMGGDGNPIYITSEPTGGYQQKPAIEKVLVRNYIGSHSTWGAVCRHESNAAFPADMFASFGDWMAAGGVSRQCRMEDEGEAGHLEWTVPADAPDEIYYASYTKYNVGGPIRVCDKVDNGQCL